MCAGPGNHMVAPKGGANGGGTSLERELYFPAQSTTA